MKPTSPLAAALTIGRVSSDVETIRLRVIDEASQSVALQLELTPEQFALALTGQASRPGKARWLTAHIGRAWEAKTETAVPYTGGDRADALSRFEVDGWVGLRGDLGNHHRRTGPDAYRIRFTRYAERYEGERADLDVLRRFARSCPRDYAEGQSPEIAAVLRAVESYFTRSEK